VADDLRATAYRLEAARGRLVFTQAPSQPGRLQSGVEVDLTCGYGAAATDDSEPLRHAIRLLAARWFERRGDVTAAMRFVAGARTFNVLAAHDPDGRKRDLVCLVEEVSP
jgi:uncharacterized phiE125 gp8 family phage protein